MKKCTIGLLTKLIAFLVMIGFFLPLTLLFLRLFLHDTQVAPSLQQTYLLGVLLFGSILLFAAYRTLPSLYISYPISWAVTALAHVGCYWYVRRKMPKEDAPLAPA